ncbi:MAG: efflux transporter outer membrane subunit [Phenylobacterium sp.]|uniref:efflux transporter outer membrane subunit n=1 Tax=Phenylobacterium sp. TaxID=1871053 RepID=UPI0025D0B807|nr:TolC family protein [Phenylobacterium sp.]MBI1200280.1 efflux transporter outer membrane subunit [Phenylobacterium sp.]
MRSVALALAVLSTLSLGACAVARKPDLGLPAAYEAPAGPPPGVIALDTWWTAYDDPDLTTLVQQALERNPDVRTARSRIDEVEAQRWQAILQYLPQGDASYTSRRTHTDQLAGTTVSIPGFTNSGASVTQSANFNVSWEVDPFGRGLFAAKAANAEVAQLRYAYETTRATIAAQTADAWFQAKGLAIQLADARQTVRIQSELYDLATRKAEAGLAGATDADRVAGELAAANAQVEALDAQLQVQKRAILILAGRVVEPTANIEATPEVGAIPAVPAALPSELLERRPDVRGAQAALRSQKNQKVLDALALFPTFSFTPSLGWQKVKQPGFSSTSQNWVLGGTVTQPILSIPRLLSEWKAQDARTEQAVITYEKTVQTAFQEAESALVNLGADRRRVALLTDGEVRARRAYDASKAAYERGLTDLSTTLQAEQSWRSVRAQLTSAEVQALRRSVQAYKAIGGGWPAQTYAAK